MDIDISNKKYKILFKDKNHNAYTYKYKNEIGQGTYGKVFLFSFNETSNCAIKIGKRKYKNDPNENEINIYKQLLLIKNYHKYIPKIYCISHTLSKCMIMMEYIRNGYLNTKLLSLISFDHMVKIIIRILEIMDVFHSRLLVINDIKPENILIDDNLMPKIIDFGLTASFFSGSMKGTPIYMPPECFRNTIVYSNNKKDIWSFGVTMCEFLLDWNPMEKAIMLKKCDNQNRIVFKSGAYFEAINKIKETFDNLYEKYENERMSKIGNIIVNCLNINHRKRPYADELISILKN